MSYTPVKLVLLIYDLIWVKHTQPGIACLIKKKGDACVKIILAYPYLALPMKYNLIYFLQDCFLIYRNLLGNTSAVRPTHNWSNISIFGNRTWHPFIDFRSAYDRVNGEAFHSQSPYLILNVRQQSRHVSQWTETNRFLSLSFIQFLSGKIYQRH